MAALAGKFIIMIFLKLLKTFFQHNTTALPSDVLDIVIMLFEGTPLINRNANISKELLDIRASPSVMFGNTSRYLLANDSCFAFTR